MRTLFVITPSDVIHTPSLSLLQNGTRLIQMAYGETLKNKNMSDNDIPEFQAEEEEEEEEADEVLPGDLDDPEIVDIDEVIAKELDEEDDDDEKDQFGHGFGKDEDEV